LIYDVATLNRPHQTCICKKNMSNKNCHVINEYVISSKNRYNEMRD